jgi:hypothetical protein
MRKLLAAPFVVLALLLFTYSVAAAWSNSVTGVAKCTAGVRSIDYTFDATVEPVDGLATWTVTRTTPEPFGQVITAGSTTVPASGAPVTVGVIVPSTGTYNIFVVTTWHNAQGVLLDHHYVSLQTKVKGDCVPPVTTTTPPVCYEDEPCWNCETMGNRICGPTTTVPPVTTVPPTTRCLYPTSEGCNTYIPTTTVPPCQPYPADCGGLPVPSTVAPAPEAPAPHNVTELAFTDSNQRNDVVELLAFIGIALFILGLAALVAARKEESAR